MYLDGGTAHVQDVHVDAAYVVGLVHLVAKDALKIVVNHAGMGLEDGLELAMAIDPNCPGNLVGIDDALLGHVATVPRQEANATTGEIRLGLGFDVVLQHLKYERIKIDVLHSIVSGFLSNTV